MLDSLANLLDDPTTVGRGLEMFQKCMQKPRYLCCDGKRPACLSCPHPFVTYTILLKECAILPNKYNGCLSVMVYTVKFTLIYNLLAAQKMLPGLVL